MSYFGTEHVEGQAVGVEPDELPPIVTGLPALDFAMNQGGRVAQNYRQQYKVDSPFSLEFELEEAWKSSLDELERRTGERLDMKMGMRSFKAYAETTLGKPPSASGYGDDLPETINNFNKVNDAIKALRDPKLKSFEQVLQEVMEMRKEVSGETAQVNEGGGVAGTVAEFIGAAAGTITQRDPLTVATLGVGGVGKTIAAKVLADTAIGAVLSAPGAIETEDVRELLGEAEGSPLLEILYGALGAGGLRGAAEGLGKLAEGRSLGTLEIDDPIMRQMFEVLPDTPKNRAVKDILDADAEVRAANPFGEGEAATERFVLELDDTYKLVNGEEPAPKERVEPFEIAARDEDFAIVKEEAPEVWAKLEEANARLERELDEHVLLVHGGSAFDEVNSARFGSGEPGGIRPLGNGLYGYVARSNDPEGLQKAIEYARVYAEKYGKGEKAIHVFSADTRSSQVGFNGAIDEAIPRLDRPANEQAWLDAYGEADKIPPGPERLAAFERARALKEATPEVVNQFRAERLPGGMLEMAALDASKLTRITSLSTATADEALTQHALTMLKARRRRANLDYEEAYRYVDRERQRLIAARRAIADASTSPDNPTLRYDSVEAEAQRAAASAEQIEETAARLATKDDTLELTVEDDGLVDIGLPERVPGDTIVTITGDDGNPRTLTIREALDELDEDVRLEEAMTTCAAGGPNEL